MTKEEKVVWCATPSDSMDIKQQLKDNLPYYLMHLDPTMTWTTYLLCLLDTPYAARLKGMKYTWCCAQQGQYWETYVRISPGRGA